MTLQKAIESGKCPTFQALCDRVGREHPASLLVTRSEWRQCQEELGSVGKWEAIREGSIMGVPVVVTDMEERRFTPTLLVETIMREYDIGRERANEVATELLRIPKERWIQWLSENI